MSRTWLRRRSHRASVGRGCSVRPARLELALLDPQVARELRLVPRTSSKEALGILAQMKDLELDAERDVGQKGVIDTA